MNDLQQLFKLRGITMQQLADELGLTMHPVQKTVKGTRVTAHIRAAVAGYLGLTVGECFGTESRRALRKLIRQEIVKKREAYELELKRKALGEPTLFFISCSCEETSFQLLDSMRKFHYGKLFDILGIIDPFRERKTGLLQ